jgi:hypothetical protein
LPVTSDLLISERYQTDDDLRSGNRDLGTRKLFTFDQFSTLTVAYYSCLQTLPAEGEVMEDFSKLMQRLLEIQSGGRKRSPDLIAEDDRLMDRLQKRTLAGKPPQAVKFNQNGPEQTRVKF